MKRVGFTLIGGYLWVGGYNYQVNLFRTLLTHEQSRIQPVLFLGNDESPDIVARFNSLDGLKIVQSKVFDRKYRLGRLFKSLVFGCDKKALNLLEQHDIDIVFEVANFYGWRFPIKTIAWLPDFQHRHLRHLFGFFSYWKREIGFQVQVASGRDIMLSSEDARTDLLQFYPVLFAKTNVVKFAVPVDEFIGNSRQVAAEYSLPQHFFYMPNQFWQHKNHECVIHALSIIKQKGGKIVVAVSGSQNDHRDKSYFPKIQGMIQSLGLESDFRVLGVIPYQHVQALMQESMAVINPSRFEGWSTTVEEAKSLGVKMILSDLRVHMEQAEELAIYFEPDSYKVLAEILENFEPLPEHEKAKLRIEAAPKSELHLKHFAHAFADLATTL